jgi:uracil phosphoribosyltransferase
MENVFVFDHPLIQHKISLMRDKRTTTKEFRELVNEVAMLMAYEVTRDMPLKEVELLPGRVCSPVRSWHLCRFCVPVLVWSMVC